MWLSSHDYLVSFYLLTILTGQGHISEVVVLYQISKSSTLLLILAEYFIWKIWGAPPKHNLSLLKCIIQWIMPLIFPEIYPTISDAEVEITTKDAHTFCLKYNGENPDKCKPCNYWFYCALRLITHTGWWQQSPLDKKKSQIL